MDSETLTPQDTLNEFPEPCQIIPQEGETTFSDDVRLATSNVVPLQRKAMRAIFSDAGIRVVANKKKFVIEVYVKEPEAEDVDVSDVPEFAREGFYTVSIQDNVVQIKAVSQEGALWGAQAFADLFIRHRDHGRIQNLIFRAWPQCSTRGLFADDRLRVDTMDAEDCFHLVASLADLRMNHLAAPLFGWTKDKQGEGLRPALLSRLPEESEALKSEECANAFNEEDDELPSLYLLDNYKEFVNYTHERGLQFAPIVDGLAMSAPFGVWAPEASALDENGNPKGRGICWTNSKAKQFCGNFYAAFLSKYFPKGLDALHLILDTTKTWGQQHFTAQDMLCECSSCQKGQATDVVQGYISWFVDTLRENGVNKIIFWDPEGWTKSTNAVGQNDEVITDWQETTIGGTTVKLSPDSLAAVACPQERCDWGTELQSLSQAMWYGNLKDS